MFMLYFHSLRVLCCTVTYITLVLLLNRDVFAVHLTSDFYSLVYDMIARSVVVAHLADDLVARFFGMRFLHLLVCRPSDEAALGFLKQSLGFNQYVVDASLVFGVKQKRVT
jgi:hypothetical protein